MMKKWMLLMGVVSSMLIAGEPAVEDIDRVQAVYFSHQDPMEDRLIEWIDRESKSIRVAVYCVMNTKIAKALKRAHVRGVDVEVIVDPYSVKVRSPLKKMVDAGIPVYVWKPTSTIGKKKGLMHHKFCVLGGHTVWTGSFNFTKEATLANRENAVLIKGSKAAAEFLDQFVQLKAAGGCPYADFLKTKNG